MCLPEYKDIFSFSHDYCFEALNTNKSISFMERYISYVSYHDGIFPVCPCVFSFISLWLKNCTTDSYLLSENSVFSHIYPTHLLYVPLFVITNLNNPCTSNFFLHLKVFFIHIQKLKAQPLLF